jgi:excisionase family DNA binding protein
MAELINTKQVAELLMAKANTVEIWRCRGEGPPFIKVGRSVRYRRSDVDAWLDKQTRQSTSEQASR